MDRAAECFSTLGDECKCVSHSIDQSTGEEAPILDSEARDGFVESFLDGREEGRIGAVDGEDDVGVLA
jgi:hypothetical protein